MPWFYDHLEDTFAELIAIDRMYCLQFNDFFEEHWEALNEIYASLPGHFSTVATPNWFGAWNSAIYLYASAEPPGLQVAGTLRRQDWAAWAAAFQEQVELADLPRYQTDWEY